MLNGYPFTISSIVLYLLLNNSDPIMSFLQLITKPPPQYPPSNPVFLQLEKHKVLPRWNSFKSQPKDRTSSDPDQPSAYPSANALKPRTASLKHKLFARGKNTTHSNLLDKKPHDSQNSSPSSHQNGRLDHPSSISKVQYHHSFSNYLSKKPPGRRRTNLHGRLMYFDLNEIVNKIASPIKLEHKLDGEELTLSPDQKKQRNLAEYQRFLKEVNHEKSRYHQHDAALGGQVKQNSGRTCLNANLDSGYMQRKRPHTLWLRKPPSRSRDSDIQPWLQNEQQHSPIRTQKYNSAFQIEHPMIQDFEDMMT